MELNEKTLSQLKERLEDARSYLHIDDKTTQLSQLDAQISKPGFWDDVEHAQDISKQAGSLRDLINSYNDALALFENIQTAFELAQEDPAFKDEALSACKKLTGMLDSFELESWFTGQFDSGDAILTINPGQGGLEANDWTDMLFKMYSHYVEDKPEWKLRVLDVSYAEAIGLDRATIQVEGRNAYGMLRSEAGVHRLVRISPTDAKARRHTTFASVEVLPVLPETVEVNLDLSDVRVDVYRSSGPGGQCVNTTDSAVRLIHEPTGIVVTCQNEKSQIQNKEAAFRVLKAKLYDLEQQKRQAEIDQLRGERMENSFGSQIRNYVLYPYQMVKDVRSGIEKGDVDGVLAGKIDDFVIGFHKWNASQ